MDAPLLKVSDDLILNPRHVGRAERLANGTLALELVTGRLEMPVYVAGDDAARVWAELSGLACAARPDAGAAQATAAATVPTDASPTTGGALP